MDEEFDLEKRRLAHCRAGNGWRGDRRHASDLRLGRRKSDAHFPYNPSFVAQALAQGEVRDGGVPGVPDGLRPIRYGDAPGPGVCGRLVKKDV